MNETILIKNTDKPQPEPQNRAERRALAKGKLTIVSTKKHMIKVGKKKY